VLVLFNEGKVVLLEFEILMKNGNDSLLSCMNFMEKI